MSSQTHEEASAQLRSPQRKITPEILFDLYGPAGLDHHPLTPFLSDPPAVLAGSLAGALRGLLRRPVLLREQVRGSVDFQADLQIRPWFPDAGQPLEVTGDGNCLLNAVSVALTGEEKLSALLRLAAGVRLRAERERFLERIRQQDLRSLVLSDVDNSQAAALAVRPAFPYDELFDREVARGFMPGQHLGFLHVWSLACCLERPIRCLCPGPVESHQRRAAAGPWEPWNSTAEPLTIAWVKYALVCLFY
jgi:hypothetical protein